MFEEEVATLNGHAGTSVFVTEDVGPDPAAWPLREDVWGTPAESAGPGGTTGGPAAEEAAAHFPTAEFGSFQEGPPVWGEDPAESWQQESWQPEYGQQESWQPEYGQPEYGVPEYGEPESPFGPPSPEPVPFGETPSVSGSLGESAADEIGSGSWTLEHSEGENGVREDPSETAPTATGIASFETPFEITDSEDAAYEDVSVESVHAGSESGYEDSPFESTGYEYIPASHPGPTSESAFIAEFDPERHPPGDPGYAAETNPELMEWPDEVLAEDWAASGEASAPWDGRFGVAEHLHEEVRPTTIGGQRLLSGTPLLRTHRGTQPDLVVRWNAMPTATTLVDVVVHLHGYSASGPQMRILDKAGASGVDLVASTTARGVRPMLGIIPRGNFFGGRSGTGYNFPALTSPGAITQLVAGGLDLLRQQTGVRARMGRLILTGHSGGGAPVDAILRHTDADAVYLFDGSYGDMSHLIAWARRRIARETEGSALRVFFRPNSGTASHALAVAAAICPAITASPHATALHRRFRVESTSVSHNLIPRTFGGRLLVDGAADLPGTTPQGCAHRGSRPGTPPSGPAPEPGPRPGGAPPLTRTPDRMAGIVKVTPYAADGTRALPGAVALAAQWRRLTDRTAGTFNVRNTSFGKRSLHSEGRAVDCHGHVTKPAEAAQAEAYIGWLMTNAVELQVSTIIWNRRIWSWPRRAQGWRDYMAQPGRNPHVDHFHVDLSWEGARHPSPLFAGDASGPGVGVPTVPTPGMPAPPQVSPPSGSAPSGSAPSGSKRTPAEFVRMFGAFARESETRTGVPGLVTLAQAAVESGWGAKAAGHNFFGIKARAGDPADTRQLWRTREVLGRPDVRTFPEVISVTRRADGRYDYVVRDWFRVFPSAAAAFIGHGEFLRRNKRYAPAFAVAQDPYRFAAEVAKAGYATDPRYTAVVHSVMRLLERSGWR